MLKRELTNGDKDVPSKRKCDTNPDDNHYFNDYADLGIHRTMIEDSVRTDAYRWAILKNYKMFYKKTVLDVGCGTGILSVFCCQAGAAHVYAVDASNIIHKTKQVVASNKLCDKITVLHGRIEDVTLPHKVDIIVSEWMGYALFYESMLHSVIYARDAWLKPGGIMFPNTCSLRMAPSTHTEVRETSLHFWSSLHNKYNINMTPLETDVNTHIHDNVHILTVPADTIIGRMVSICELELESVSYSSLSSISREFRFSMFGSCELEGLVLWFVCGFPGGSTLSTSPYSESTHWEQAMVLTPTHHVEQDTVLEGTLTLTPGEHHHRDINIKLTAKLEGEDYYNHIYALTAHPPI